MSTFGLLIVGSRSFQDYDEFTFVVDGWLSNVLDYQITIVTGDAYGADAMARRYAKEHGYDLVVFKPDWSVGKSAGYIRNKRMHDYLSSNFTVRGCGAFWDLQSRGTTHSFNLAKQYNTPLQIWDTVNHITYSR